jgi:hypothetical protein
VTLLVFEGRSGVVSKGTWSSWEFFCLRKYGDLWRDGVKPPRGRVSTEVK